jgi:hypothetical protein
MENLPAGSPFKPGVWQFAANAVAVAEKRLNDTQRHA